MDWIQPYSLPGAQLPMCLEGVGIRDGSECDREGRVQFARVTPLLGHHLMLSLTPGAQLIDDKLSWSRDRDDIRWGSFGFPLICVYVCVCYFVVTCVCMSECVFLCFGYLKDLFILQDKHIILQLTLSNSKLSLQTRS